MQESQSGLLLFALVCWRGAEPREGEAVANNAVHCLQAVNRASNASEDTQSLAAIGGDVIVQILLAQGFAQALHPSFADEVPLALRPGARIPRLSRGFSRACEFTTIQTLANIYERELVKIILFFLSIGFLSLEGVYEFDDL